MCRWTSLACLKHVLPNGLHVFAAVQAGLERRDIELQRLGMGSPGLELALVAKQPSVHFPELALILRAMGGFRGLEGRFVHGFEGQVEHRITQFAGLDICLGELWVRLTDVTTTERSLVVGELDKREPGCGLALDRVVAQVKDLAAHLRACRARGPLGLQEPLDLLELSQNRLLPSLQRLDFLSHVWGRLLRGPR